MKTSVRPDIIGHVKLYDVGGRRGTTPADELRCIMALDGERFDVRLYFVETGPLAPGETGDIPIRFLALERAKRHLNKGKKFTLREHTPIGEGTIKQVFGS
jgi:hypothetical protein